MYTKEYQDSSDGSFTDRLFAPARLSSAAFDCMLISSLFFTGAMKAHLDFIRPYLIACRSFMEEEKIKFPRASFEQNFRDYNELARFNLQIARTGMRSSQVQVSEYHKEEFIRFFDAFLNTMYGRPGETVDAYTTEKLRVLRNLVVDYPDAIRDIGESYGFHPEQGGYELVAETPRMELYQVLPTDPTVETDPRMKPIVICPPYVLGPAILVFLPGENKSYVHAYANRGIPTYLRVLKDIQTNAPTQIMNGEDDALDTSEFCRIVKDRHGKPVTLNGFCQGGFICLADLLSGVLDGLVDALITCVAPMDGTRSVGLVEYLEHIAPRFRDLSYAKKRLPSGNVVIDGHVMSWVYKLKSIWREAPLFTYYRDLRLFEHMLKKGISGVSSTAAAINHWLIYDRVDLPVDITQLSFDSYTIPITPDGDLPFRFFGRKLNFDYIREKNIRFQICYAARDDLVDPPAALAPQDYCEVELAEFPKGHAAIATSWSKPGTEYSLDRVFPNGQRGPVRFQLDLDRELNSQ